MMMIAICCFLGAPCANTKRAAKLVISVFISRNAVFVVRSEYQIKILHAFCAFVVTLGAATPFWLAMCFARKALDLLVIIASFFIASKRQHEKKLHFKNARAVTTDRRQTTTISPQRQTHLLFPNYSRKT